jgi:hypothetical protein
VDSKLKVNLQVLNNKNVMTVILNLGAILILLCLATLILCYIRKKSIRVKIKASQKLKKNCDFEILEIEIVFFIKNAANFFF